MVAKSETRYGSLFNFMAEPTQEQMASTLSKAAPNYYQSTVRQRMVSEANDLMDWLSQGEVEDPAS